MKIEPLWNKKLDLREGGGRDPLGLSILSNHITQQVIPGITDSTTIARYYSFYTWAIKTVNQEFIGDWRDFLKRMVRLESAWVIGCILDKDESHPDVRNPIGNNKARRRLDMSEDHIDVNFSLFSNTGGIYAQYFTNPLRQLGLTFYMKGKHVLTERGIELADIFERGISDTEYFKSHMDEDVLSIDVLKEYGWSSSYPYLKNTDEEKRALTDLLFDENQNSDGKIAFEHSRRYTLLLHLDLYRLYSGIDKKYDSEAFRDIIYYGENFKEGKSIHYDPENQGIQEVLLYWKHFQFHDYFTFSLETLLIQFLEQTKKQDGTTTGEFLDTFERSYTILRDHVGLTEDDFTLEDVLEKMVGSREPMSQETSEILDRVIRIDSDFSESSLRRLIDETDVPEEKMAYNLLLMLVSIVRYYRYLNVYDDNIFWIKNKENAEFSLHSFIMGLNRDIRHMTPRDFLKTLLYEVINKHDHNALKKLQAGRETHKFERRGDRYIFKKDYGYVLRSSRFSTIKYLFEDLGLIKEVGDTYKITDFGEDVLERYIHE